MWGESFMKMFSVLRSGAGGRAAIVAVAMITAASSGVWIAQTASAEPAGQTTAVHWVGTPPAQVLRPVVGDTVFTVSAEGPAGTHVTWSGRGAICRNTARNSAECRVRDRSRGGTLTFTARTAHGAVIRAKTQVLDDVSFVSMGDSYASGEANPPFITDEFDTTADGCHRSPIAGTRQLAEQAPVPRTGSTTFRHVACSGARIVHLTTGSKGEPGQIPSLAATSDVSLTTLAIGGNDLGFGTILGQCLPGPEACAAALAAAQAQLDAITTPSPEYGGVSLLERTYRDARAAAPQGRLAVVGYPLLFPAGDVTACAPLTAPVISSVNAIETELNRRIALITENVEGAVFVDLATPFAGHASCEPDVAQRWLTFIDQTNPVYSLHPNAKGQAAIAEAIKDTLEATPLRLS
jgi:lysophospholipase L1-like esterase